MKLSKKQWIKLIEFLTISAATWLNPGAGFLLFLLKLCFYTLGVLAEQEQQQTQAKTERKEEEGRSLLNKPQ